ncbi:MAG: TolC family protein [Gemmatimonadota bacterium]
MTFRSALCSITLLALAGPVAAQNPTVMLQPAGAGQSVTLPQAIVLAQKVQPTSVQALGSVRSAQAQQKVAFGEWLPSLNGNASTTTSYSSASRLNTATNSFTGGTTQSVNMGLSSSWDVFTGFRRGADHRAAEATRDAAEAALIDSRFQVALNTTTAFFDALAASQLVTVRQSTVKQAVEQLKISINKLKAGSTTRSDSLRSVVSLGTAQLQLAQTLSALATDEARLAQLIGVRGRVSAADDSSFYHMQPAPDSAALFAEALDAAPTVRNTEALARAARAQLTAAKAGYWPTVALSANTNWSGSDPNNYRLNNQSSLSLGLSWNIFNKFIREQTITLRDIAVDNANAIAADQRHLVESSLTGALADLEAAQLGISISATSVDAAQEDLRVQQERYRVGAGTILEVLTSQAALTQAQVDEVNARFTYLEAKARIEAQIGRPL